MQKHLPKLITYSKPCERVEGENCHPGVGEQKPSISDNPCDFSFQNCAAKITEK
jgi:hypothetical protein